MKVRIKTQPQQRYKFLITNLDIASLIATATEQLNPNPSESFEKLTAQAAQLMNIYSATQRQTFLQSMNLNLDKARPHPSKRPVYTCVKFEAVKRPAMLDIDIVFETELGWPVDSIRYTIADFDPSTNTIRKNPDVPDQVSLQKLFKQAYCDKARQEIITVVKNLAEQLTAKDPTDILSVLQSLQKLPCHLIPQQLKRLASIQNCQSGKHAINPEERKFIINAAQLDNTIKQEINFFDIVEDGIF